MNLNEDELYGNISVCVTSCVNSKIFDLRYIQLKQVNRNN